MGDKREMVRINTGDSSFDKIWAHYKSPGKYPLTPNQEEVKERWLSAWTLLRKAKNKTKTARIIQDLYNISRAQAFKDIRNAEKLFGNVMRADRDGQMTLLYEFALKGFNKAMKKGDLKVAKSFHDSMMACLGDEDTINFNPEKLENKPIKMSINKDVANAIISHLLKGSLDFNDLTIDADFEEVEGDE